VRTPRTSGVLVGAALLAGALSAPPPSPASPSAADRQTLLDLGITLDVDLRNAQERSDDPDRPPAGIAYKVADVEDLTHGVSFADPALGGLLYGFLMGLGLGDATITTLRARLLTS
jgi:Tyrosine phosphatase family